MRLRKPIVIVTNRKRQKWAWLKRLKRKWLTDEQAATLDRTERHRPMMDWLKILDLVKACFMKFAGQKTANQTRFKRMIAATLSAIVVGGFFGFVMLHLFNDVGSTTNGSAPTTTQQMADEKSKKQQVVLQPLHAFILQGGVFKDEKNAETWLEKFKKNGSSAMLWQEDDDYILLAGIAETKEEATKHAKDFKDLDIYVKEWKADERRVKLTHAEAKWLDSFVDTWNHTKKTLSTKQVFPIDQWKTLMDDAPKSKTTQALQKQIKASIKKAKADDERNDFVLLKTWKVYQQLGKP